MKVLAIPYLHRRYDVRCKESNKGQSTRAAFPFVHERAGACRVAAVTPFAAYTNDLNRRRAPLPLGVLMTHDELAAIALRYDTLVSDAMLRALGVDRPKRKPGSTRDRSAKRRKYHGARKLMKQTHGVRL